MKNIFSHNGSNGYKKPKTIEIKDIKIIIMESGFIQVSKNNELIGSEYNTNLYKKSINIIKEYVINKFGIEFPKTIY